MRPPELSPRDRRALRIGAVVFVALLATRAVPPLVAWRADSLHRSDAMLQSVEEARNSALHLRELRVVVDAMRDEVRLREERLLPAGSASAGGVALATLVSDAAEAAGLRLESVQAIPTPYDSAAPSVAGSYPVVRVRGDGASDIEGIATFLLLIENDSLLLVVRELQVNQPQVALPDDQQETLATTFVVEARMRRAKRTS